MARDVRFVSQKETYIVLNQYHEHRWKSTKIKYTCQAGKNPCWKIPGALQKWDTSHANFSLAKISLHTTYLKKKRELIFCYKSIGSYRNFNIFLACKCNYTRLSVFHNTLRICLRGNSSPIIIFTNYAVLCSRYNSASSIQLWTSKLLTHRITPAIYSD